MTTERIDVLAVMDAAAEHIWGEYAPGDDKPLREARAAVAELIEKATVSLAHVERRAAMGCLNASERADLEPFRAALARVQGGAK